MRPDEHKRKKNAQYKKKHGLSEKESKSDVKPKRGSKETKEENSTKTKTDPIAPKGVQENKVKVGLNIHNIQCSLNDCMVFYGPSTTIVILGANT